MTMQSIKIPQKPDDYEHKRMTVRRMTAYTYTSLYLSFGWTLE